MFDENFQSKSEMKIMYFCPLWGSESMPFDQFLQRVKDAGYHGVEMSFPINEKERNQKAKLIDFFGLKIIAQHWETVDKDFTLHRNNFEKRLRNLAKTKLLFINSQTGKDYYSFDQNSGLFNLANAIAKEAGVPIFHETHRGKWSFAAHITKEYLDRLPGLRITLDISHWCITAESFLEDQTEAIDIAVHAVDHLHARVGYTEGPQVPDPRVLAWEFALNHHVKWWDQVIEAKKNQGKKSFTVTPEFGAPPDMVLHPKTDEPLVSQWDINVWIMNLFKRRYLN